MVGVPQLIESWAHFYGDHKAVSAGVTYIHLSGILLAGGLSISADRLSFKLGPEFPCLQDELVRLYSVHRWVILGLGVTIASGLLMLFADLHTFISAPLYWTKMGLLALLLGNGYLRLRSEVGLRQGQDRWRTFHRTSAASLALWFMVLLCGAFLSTIS